MCTKTGTEAGVLFAVRWPVDNVLEGLNGSLEIFCSNGLAVWEGGPPVLQRVCKIRELDVGILLEIVQMP